MDEEHGCTAEAGGEAARGVQLNVAYLVQRLEAALRAEREMEALRARLRELGAKRDGEDPARTDERAQLQNRLAGYSSLSDSAATSILRALMSADTLERKQAASSAPAQQTETPRYEELLERVLGDEF